MGVLSYMLFRLGQELARGHFTGNNQLSYLVNGHLSTHELGIPSENNDMIGHHANGTLSAIKIHALHERDMAQSPIFGRLLDAGLIAVPAKDMITIDRRSNGENFDSFARGIISILKPKD
jgi:hypothetical protein